MKLLEVLIKKKDNLHLEVNSNDLKIEKNKSIPKGYLSYDELSIVEVKDDVKVDKISKERHHTRYFSDE